MTRERRLDTMTRRTIQAATLIGIAALAGPLAPAPDVRASVSGDFQMEILVDGVPLREYRARGTTYVEARPNAEYSIRLHNRSARRVAVALAVDGLNSIDARSGSARRASKWVLDPFQSITIDGWQTSDRDARRFFFTTEDNSYGAWLDKTANLGVIEAVVFRERRMPHENADSKVRREAAPRGAAGAPGARSEAADEREGSAKRPADELAATGIGRRVDHPVRRVHLDLEPRPTATVGVRYEYRDQLVALGVLPLSSLSDDLDRREQARGFTDSGYCPDPYDGR
jgi:hypothetical protein